MIRLKITWKNQYKNERMILSVSCSYFLSNMILFCQVRRGINKMNRNFKLYFWGVAISNIGNILCSFASSIYLLDMTGSPFIMSLFLGYSLILNLILTPFMGTFCDKHSKIKLLYSCDWLSSLVNLCFGMLILLQPDKVIVLILLVILITLNAIINSIFTPASMCALPILVEENMLSKAYSKFTTMMNSINIFGMIFSAIIYSFLGYPILLIINGISYGISAFFEMFIHSDEKEYAKESTSFFDDTKKGFLYLVSHKELLALAEVSVLANIFISAMFSVTVPFLINTKFNLDPIILAILQVSMALGGIQMAMKMSKKELAMKTKNNIYLSFICIAVSFLVFSISSYAYETIIVNLFLYVLVTVFAFFIVGKYLVRMQIDIDTNYATHIEAEYMARVMAIRSVLSSSSAPFAIIIFGALLDIVNYFPLLIFMVMGIIASALFAYKSKELENF